MALDDLYQALSIFKQNVNDLKMRRTLANANDAVHQIRSSEADETEKMNQLRGVAENLTFNLAAQGVPGTTLQALTQYIPKQPTPQSAEQAVLFGDPRQAASGQALLDQQNAQQLQLERERSQSYIDRYQAKQSVNADTKSALDPVTGLVPSDQKRLDKFGQYIQSDEKTRNAFSQNAITVQNANRLKALVGSDLSDEHLNSIAPQFVTEAAAALARQVTGGSPSDELIGQLIPKDIAMDTAKATSYLTNKMQGAGAADFIRTYYRAANRESATAQDQIEKSVLQRSQTYADLFQKSPKAAKALLAQHLDGAEPEDFNVDEKGRLRYAPAQQRQQKLDVMLNGVKGLLMKANSKGDIQTKADAIQKLKLLNIEPGTPLNQIRQDLEFRVNSGEF